MGTGASTTVAGGATAAVTPLTWMDLGTTPPANVPTTSFALWSPNKQFTQGAVIINPLNAHFYAASVGGQSGSMMPAFPVTVRATVVDSKAGLKWMDLGTGVPSGLPSSAIALWSPNKQFTQGAVIINPINGHFYVASIGGKSGGTMPNFPVSPPATVAEAPAGAVTWMDAGTTAPGGAPANLASWTANTTFTQGQIVYNPTNSHYYVASVGGQSGAIPPVFPVTIKPPISDGNTLWQDSGTVPPSSVSSTGPSDQVVSLLNLQLPQVHTLYIITI
jgi:hypothetical protein